jgi:YD repeat-containing protein
VDGVPYTTGATYTAFGAVATQTYADGEVITYGYTAGAVTSVTANPGAITYVSGIAYDATGHVIQLTLGNGAVTTQTYDPVTLRLQHRVTVRGGGTVQDLTYTYDSVGNILTLTDAVTPANTQTFTYDTLDRLVTATAPTGYGTEVYQYDAIGNLTSKAGITYSYAGTVCGRAMPHAVKSTSDGKTYTYDCNGNMLSDGTRTLTWDADNKPVSILSGGSTTTFAYSGDGARVRKQTGSMLIRYAGGLEDHVTDGSQVKYITVGGLPVATRVVGGIHAGIYYLHGDHLGSLQALTNSSGQVVQRLTYKPFGETFSNTGSVDFEQHRFTGQEQDPEAAFHSFRKIDRHANMRSMVTFCKATG